MHRLTKRRPLVGILCALALPCFAAPFEKTIHYVQPDGATVELWGKGDEFHAVFETLDGYTVVYVPELKAYYYATLSPDGTDLVQSTLQVGQGDPARLGVPKHLRMGAAKAATKAKARFDRWDAGTRNSERWRARKSALQAAEAAATDGPVALSPPAYTTTGTKVGLCLLIDFSDDVATVPKASIVDFCNGDAYTGYDNNGSVKKYFQDNSNNTLTYTNIVTVYVRMVQPKTYYNDTSKDCGDQGNLLVRDAIAILKALPNYATEIAPAMANLTVDASGNVVACNVFFAGGNSGVWTYGLWPHSWVLYNVGAQTLTTGVKVYPYQITNIGSTLTLGTFCHENGHMLCDYPDIYDYDRVGNDYDSKGGAGMFCLMNSGGSGGNPVQICAYLKRGSGWATTINLTSNSTLTASVTSAAGAGFNTFYRFAKPGVATEYYLVENRQKSGRDANLPASGIAVWHIDELGNHNNQSLAYNSTHANYEVTLVQADNLWHFQNNVNSGDARDLYYSGNAAGGYTNAFTDATAPSARWWNGTASGLRFSNFSVSGSTMTFAVAGGGLVILTASPLPTGYLGMPYSQTLTANGGATPYAWQVVAGSLPAGLTLASGGELSGTPSAVGTAAFTVRVTDATNGTATAAFSLTVSTASSVPFTENFEHGGSIPAGWTQEQVSEATDWTFAAGGVNLHPASAHGGSYNARFYIADYTAPKTRLVTPMLSFGTRTQNAQLSFWHCMANWAGDQDELRVYYRTTTSDPWTLLTTYTSDVTAWTQRTIALPSPIHSCLIAFEGTAKYGYGVCVDDVSVTANLSPYGTWQTNWFSQVEIAAGQIARPGDDPDNDTIVNLLEYAWWLNPRVANTTGFPVGGVWNQYLAMTYRQNKQATDLVYAAEACTNLITGVWSTNNISETSRADSNQWWSVTVRHNQPATNAPRRFLRLNVTLP